MDAQYNLGLMYEKGKGVEQSYEEAKIWYLKAADHNDYYAFYRLGRLYENGWGVPQSDSVALSWYEKASDEGCRYAQKKLKLWQNECVGHSKADS